MGNISVEEARRLSRKVLIRAGMDDSEADIITDILTEAEMSGRPTHGLIRLSGIASRAQDQSDVSIRIVNEDGNYALLDGTEKLGYTVAHYAMNLAIEKAQESGLALVGVKNSGHSGMLGYYPRMALKYDLIGIAICNTRPMVAAWGGTEPVFGTNPIAVAVPSDDLPLVLDMSTSSVTYGDLLVAIREGKEIPADSALDSSGKPTVNPEKARGGVLLPFGGYKGFGLGIVVQILAGALVDAEILKTGGILLMSIDPCIFLPVDEFKKRVSQYLDFVKSSKRKDDITEILIPGERSARYRQKCLKNGISVDDSLLKQVRDLADK